MATDPERGSFDDGALIRMFLQHGPQVRRALIKRTRSAEAADEILHQAYIQIRKSADLSSVRNDGAYLQTVAINIFNTLYRKERREKSFITYDSDVVETLSESVASEPQLDAEIDELALHAAIARLPNRQRAAVALQLHGLTYQEIAQRLTTTTQAVGQLLYSARQKLETILKAPGQGKEKP